MIARLPADRQSSGPTGPAVSFVVIAFDEAPSIGRCLRALTAQHWAGTVEIIVVDDGSSDGTSHVAQAVGDPRIRVIRHDTNRGRGAARLTGLGAATGDLVATVDSDVVVAPDWLERCHRAMERDGLDAVGGIPVPDGDVTFLANRFGLRPRPVPPTIPVSGTNGLYRASVFERLAFDPTLVEGEDVALNRAMEQAGLRIRTLTDVVVEHRERKGFVHSLRWLYQSGRGATRQLWRYRQVRLPDLAFAGQLAACALAWVPALPARTRRVLPGAYLVGVSTLHMARKFEFRAAPDRFAAATAANSALFAAYFAGRLTGIPASLRADRP